MELAKLHKHCGPRCEGVALYAPQAYWRMEPCVVDGITGGCGPGKFGDKFVPDTLWGLSVKPACRIHDFMYGLGGGVEEKNLADVTFLTNMMLIIKEKSKTGLTRWLRMWRAMTYYNAVADFGLDAFTKREVSDVLAENPKADKEVVADA